MKKYDFLIVFVLALLLHTLSVLAQDLPPSYIITGVPAIKQGPYQCGATCVAMGMQYYGRNLTKDDVFATVGGPGLRRMPGTVYDRILRYLKSSDFETEVYHTTDWEKWKRELIGNHLIISLGVNRKTNNAHFILITGYDDNRIITYSWKPDEEYKGGFLVHDPNEGREDWYDYDFMMKKFVATSHPNSIRNFKAAIAFWPKDMR